MLKGAAIVLLVLLTGASAIAADTCRIPRGAHVVLFGGVDDPDVLVWDSRERLAAFSGGSADARSFLLPHAILNRPGTRALVVTCFINAVHPKFSSDPADAVGVLILSGKYRGRYGWVTSLDIHGRRVPMNADNW